MKRICKIGKIVEGMLLVDEHLDVTGVFLNFEDERASACKFFCWEPAKGFFEIVPPKTLKVFPITNDLWQRIKIMASWVEDGQTHFDKDGQKLPLHFMFLDYALALFTSNPEIIARTR